MGRGIALQFKNAFPDNFKAYAAACRRDDVQPGRMFVFETGHVTNPHYIIYFPTKRHWRGKSRLSDIEAGLEALATEIQRREIRSIALPPLGSGLGGLSWGDVRRRIEGILSPLEDVRIVVYEPRGAPRPHSMTTSRDVPKMTPGRATLVRLMERYLTGLMDPFVTLLEVHKLMYFMQEAGQALRLSFKRGHYGPYAENLRHVLKAIEGHMVAGYADGGDAPDKELTIVPGVAAEAEALLEGNMEAKGRFDRVSRLVDGFETPVGLELLATVHWLVTREGSTTRDDVIRKTHAWGPTKRQFSESQVRVALEVLAREGWLPEDAFAS
jgi:O-acetyl-ADP-ribose deacetylase (regulator of RNase III)